MKRKRATFPPYGNRDVETVVLAAGLGTRMKSSVPKVLHKICEKPILWWVLRSVFSAGSLRVVVVCRHAADDVVSAVKSWRPKECASGRLVFAAQKKQLGSGDALKSALGKLSGKCPVLVIPGDAPLLRPSTLKRLVEFFRRSAGAALVLSADIEEPFGYGRIMRSPSGEFLGIIEEKDARLEEKNITEINAGVYCFAPEHLKSALSSVRPVNAKKEYYLTDVIGILRKRGLGVIAKKTPQADEVVGINTRADLWAAERNLRAGINGTHMESGVTFLNPENTFVGPDVRIGRDTTIGSGVSLVGSTAIGSACVIGHGSYIKDSSVGAASRIRASYIYESRISSDVLIGPFAHIRPGTDIKSGSRVGNFTEIKNSFVGEGTKLSHLAYVGDTYLEGDINVGAGAITCNYDGVKKRRTRIGRGSFIGSNVNLVAPVKIGRRSLVGAGSTITRDVPDGTLAVERGSQIHKPRKKRR
ncbi:MAG: bifunctional UDP-N-acetylglucosamine diphosphorylase/glucosamine-1-phosphate N-acetyltransferase GlmU [Endomicrobiia bacterium]|nr:bifunctional UDP-N-acetylglucosamine diphosphorylase/glucosamine-1-phosphate N-acetyltransferase GlmU [Endomicrobiia bacterium]